MCKLTTKRFTLKKLRPLITLTMRSESHKDSWFLKMTLLDQRCGNPSLRNALFTLTTQHQVKKLGCVKLFRESTTIFSLSTGDHHFNPARILSSGPATSKMHFWRIKMLLKTSFGAAKTPVHWLLSTVLIMMLLRQSSDTSEHFRENDWETLKGVILDFI